MFPLSHRLRTDADFKRLQRNGHSVFSPSFRAVVGKNQLDHNRYAVIVSAKVSKKATVRNRLKRQLREALKKAAPKLKQGYDVALYVRSQALVKSFAELEQELERAVMKARLNSK